MLDIIEQFQKDAQVSGRDSNNMNELKRWLEAAEDEDDTDYDQYFNEEVSLDEKDDRSNKYWNIVERYIETVKDKQKLYDDFENVITDTEVKEAYGWLSANDYDYLVQDYLHKGLTLNRAEDILNSKLDEFGSEFDSFVAAIIDRVPGTELIRKDEPYITDVDWSYQGGFTIRLLGRLDNKQNDSYTIPTVELWSIELGSGDTDKFRYGHIATVSGYDKEEAIDKVANVLLNPTDRNRLSIG